MTRQAYSHDPNYQAMAEFRYQIRRFLRFSEDAARQADLEPQQYLMLLTLKGLPEGTRGRIAEVAERLQIRHHSTVELADRLAARGLIKRRRGESDRREVLLELTPKGDRLLRQLALHHREVLRDSAPGLVGALRKLLEIRNSHPARGGVRGRNGTRGKRA